MMERVDFVKAKEIMGDNFIGSIELKQFIDKLNVNFQSFDVPEIPYALCEIEKKAKDYILILGVAQLGNQPINIRFFREVFGYDPEMSEPCFYNQDWYMSEDFIDKTLSLRWYLIKKDVFEDTRAKMPENIMSNGIVFPSAILCTYTFFAYYYAFGKILWNHDFIWCSDVDHNGDRIYVGKYNDVDGVNKNGFSIHRHLALRSCYGAVGII